MPKYASWASSDVNAARWQLARDEKNVVDEYSPLVQPPCTAPRSRCSRGSTSRLLPTSAAAAGARDTGDGTYGCVATVSVSSSSAVTSLSARSAKDELRARLSHRPSSSSAMRHVGQVGKASFAMSTFTARHLCSRLMFYGNPHGIISQSYFCNRVAANLENLAYSWISLNVENSWNSQNSVQPQGKLTSGCNLSCNPYAAKCIWCTKTVDLSNMGRQALVSHMSNS